MQAVFSRSGGAPVGMPIPGGFLHITGSTIIPPVTSYVGVNGPGVTVTLPIGALCSQGYYVIIADESGLASTNPAYAISVATQGSDTLAGNSYTQGISLISINYGSVYIVWSGLGWIIGSANFSEYVLNREPYMTPSTTNVYFIQNWISSVCSPASQSFWSKQTATYSNVQTLNRNFFGSVLLPSGRVILTPGGANCLVGKYDNSLYSEINLGPSQVSSNIFQGGVLSPSGKVVFVPYYSTNIQVYVDESQSIVSSFTHGVPTPAFSGGVLDPNGNVVMIPAATTSNIGTYNAESNLYSNVVFGNFDGTFSGGVLLPNGNVVMVSNTNSNICQFSPVNKTVSNSFYIGGNSTKFSGGILVPSGNVILVPMSTNSNVGVFQPSNNTFSNIVTNTGTNSFSGGCLLPTGKVVLAPYLSANIGIVDPVSLSYSNAVLCGGSFAGATLLPDGRVFFTPRSSNIGILSTVSKPPAEFCLSPYFNKF